MRSENLKWSGRVACKWRAEKGALAMETMISQISNGVRLTTSWRNVKIRRQDLQLGKSLNSRRRVGEPLAGELEMNEVAGAASDKSPIYGLIYRRTSL